MYLVYREVVSVMSAKTTSVYAVTYAGKTVEIEFDDVLYQAACRGSDYWQMKFRGKVATELGLRHDQSFQFFELEVNRVADPEMPVVRRGICGCVCGSCNKIVPDHCYRTDGKRNCWITPR